MFTYPGKKLLFMGNEIAQWQEWDHDRSLDWELLNYPGHQGIRAVLADLNKLYVASPALHFHDFEQAGFEWIDCHDASQSVLSYMRKYDTNCIIVILNFTPVPRYNYRLGVDHPGIYREVLNSDSSYYGGSNVGNIGKLHVEDIPWLEKPFSFELTLPPLAGLILEYTS
jgi:1,4-alpha-glucan branching enzyme